MALIYGGVDQGRPYVNGKHYNAWHNGKQLWPSSAWTGTANASASTLSQDGTVVATNIIPDPTPSNAGAFCARWDNSISYDTGTQAVVLTSTSNTGSTSLINECDMYANHDAFPPSRQPSNAPVVAPGDYVFAVMAFIPVESVNVTTCSIAQYTPKTDGTDAWDELVSPTFTPAHGVWFPMVQKFSTRVQQHVYPRIRFSKSDATVSKVMVRHVGLFTASDWAAMQSLGVNWFAGDEYGKVSQ